MALNCVQKTAVACGALAAVGVAGFGYAHYETKRFTLQKVTVPVLPLGSAPLRVLHVSDFHALASQHKKLDWIRSLAQYEPDLVINTGDNLSESAAVEPLLQALEPLLSVPGVFVSGSNDYYGPRRVKPAQYFDKNKKINSDYYNMDLREPLPYDELVAGLTSHGWLDLNNARGQLTINDMLISFVGVDDPHIERDVFPSRHARSVAVERKAAERNHDAPQLRLGVVHAPYTAVLDQFVADDVDMIFAGHTHGGQVRFPFIGAVTSNSDLDPRKAKGLSGWPGARPDYAGSARSKGGTSKASKGSANGGGATTKSSDDNVWLHVSAGAGSSPFFPFRFLNQPEATLLTLVAREK